MSRGFFHPEKNTCFSFSNIQLMMVLEFMFSVIYPIDFEILENTHHGSSQNPALFKAFLYVALENGDPQNYFTWVCCSGLLLRTLALLFRLTRGQDSGVITEQCLLLRVETMQRNSTLSFLELAEGKFFFLSLEKVWARFKNKQMNEWTNKQTSNREGKGIAGQHLMGLILDSSSFK